MVSAKSTSGGGGKCAADMCTKPALSGTELCPPHLQLAGVYKTPEFETVEFLADNGCNVVHNKQLRKGYLIWWQLYTLPRPFLSCLLCMMLAQPLSARSSTFSTSGVLYTAANGWWSGHSSLPLEAGFVHFSAAHLPPPCFAALACEMQVLHMTHLADTGRPHSPACNQLDCQCAWRCEQEPPRAGVDLHATAAAAAAAAR